MPLTGQARQVERLFRQPGALERHVVATIRRKMYSRVGLTYSRAWWTVAGMSLNTDVSL
jgi:hypothetical protein